MGVCQKIRWCIFLFFEKYFLKTFIKKYKIFVSHEISKKRVPQKI